jgi:cell division protein FtsB
MLRRYLRPIAALAALIGLAAYATIMLRGPRGISAWTEKRQEIRSLQEQNANLLRDINAKKERIEKLKHDPATQELELEKLGLVHQNDTQFKIAGH